MIRALLLGAFATTALATTCAKDISQPACRDFTESTDFNIANDGALNVKMTYLTTLNRAFSYVGEAPWVETAVYVGATPDAGTPQVGANSNQGPGWAMREIADVDTMDATSIETYDLNAGFWGQPTVAAGGTSCGSKTLNFVGTLQAMVSKLDVDGRYTLYFQRVLPNPITGTNIQLKWIAENACKVKVDVEFECTGSECVEVTTIVCASFAGIDASTNGRLSTECKVPAGFRVSTLDPRPPASNAVDNLVTVTHGAGSWTDNVIACNVAGTVQTNTAALGGRCFFDHTTTAAIASGTSVQGSTTYQAYVKAVGANSWTGQETLYVAPYNLTVKSGLVKTFTMDVNVRFYSDTTTTNVATTAIHDLLQEDGTTAAFPTSLAQGPFLAKSRVEMGALVQHNHAYLQVVAKVAAGSSRFKDLRVSKIVHNSAENGETTAEEAADAATVSASRLTLCSVSDLPSGTETGASCHTAGSACKNHWTASSGSAPYWPTAYMYCDGLMSTGIGQGGGAVVAGDTLVISLKWKLSKGPWTSGKAQLLQQEDAAGQSVEVSLTIQLGGGETTITTAGAGGEGSADNTVTYIIIAVCVIAAALILAVVVVAFMCLRNRSQEQLVAMSPQKATVAAVYDISQPKAKADAMDV